MGCLFRSAAPLCVLRPDCARRHVLLPTRYLQFGEVMHHVALRRAEVGDMPLVIGGDLNTLVTGITRVLPLLWDPMSVFTLGTSEAAIMKRLLAHPSRMPTSIQVALLLMGVNPTRVARPEAPAAPPLADPFDADGHHTVEELGGWWRAKLDWMLVHSLWCHDARLGGGDASDHQWLAVDVGGAFQPQ